MINENVNYQSITDRIAKGYLNRNSVEFYLYWGKINSINISNLSLVDKVFVLMCRNLKIEGIPWDLEHEYNIKLSEDDAYNILTECQCFQIEITIMVKSLLWYQFNGTTNLNEQIDFIQQLGSIDLPYTYDFPKEIKNHMKQNRAFIIIMLFLTMLCLSACSSQEKKIIGKYINIYDETKYLSFNKDGSFIDNFMTTTSNGNTCISDFYIYQIDDDGLITIIDTTEYEGQDTLDEYVLGILYKNYIGVFWNGLLSKTYEDTTLTTTVGDLILTYNFKEDKSYEFTVTLNNEIVDTENGTYTVNGNEVVCTSEDDVITTFISTKDKVFSIEYVKE